MKRLHFFKIFLAVLALAICTGTMQAAITGPASVTLTCDTSTGVAPAVNVAIKLVTAGTAVTVTPSFPVGSPLAAAPAAASVSTTTPGTNFSFAIASGCAGAINGSSVTLTFTPASGTAINVTANLTVTGPPAIASDHANGITLSCNTASGIATAGLVGIKLLAGSSVLVTPSFAQGSPLQAAPAPATVSSGIAYTNFSFSIASGCSGVTPGQTVTLVFTPATGTAINVTATLSLAGPTLALSQNAFNLSCDAFSGAGSPQSVGVTLKVAGGSQLVSVSSNPSGILTSPASQTVSSTTNAATFTFNVVSGCGGATNGQQVVITFTPATGSPIAATATISTTTPTLASAQYAGINLSCDTVLGPSPATIGITTYAATGSFTVSASPSAGTVVVGAVGSTTVASQSTPTNWSLHAAAGCRGVVDNAVVQITFTPSGGGQNLVIPATLHLTNSGSALALSPSAVTVTCTKSGNNYSNITSKTVYVTSPANYGTPFSVDMTQGNAPPAYLSATTTPGSGAVATNTAIPLLIQPNGTCGGLPVGNTVVSVNLANPPAADKVVTVNIQVGGPNPLTATPVSLTYVKGSNTFTGQATTITGTSGTYFMVDQASLPLWLNSTTSSGTTSGGTASVTFKPTFGAETLAPGTYTAQVNLKVAFALDAQVSVTLQVKSATASLVIAEKTTQDLTWVLGASNIPSLMITPISTSDAPIPYTVSTANVAGNLVPQVNVASGLAYSFGPPLSVTFLQAPFSAAAPGDTLTGTVTITPTTSGQPIVVTINIQVLSPNANITSATPANLPTALAGQQFTVVIFGTGFVPDSQNAMKTTVGVLSGGLVVPDNNVVPTVQNTNTIYLKITVPSSADPFLPFSGPGVIHIGVCNPGVNSPCYAATSQTTIGIGVNPIVQAVTSASSYLQATPPALTPVAPYDILSIFGTNFCISSGTGCTSPNSNILYGSVEPLALRYTTQLSPDPAGATQRNLSVTFQTHGSSPTVIATAPLLFATNSQINLIVPDAVKDYYTNTVDIVVNFGYGPAGQSNLLSSAPFSVNIAPTNPGVFAMNGNGQGDAAALSTSNALISQSNPVGINTASDTIQLYVTGLGLPDSDGTTSSWGNVCMAPAAYYPLASNAAIGMANALGLTPPVALTSNDGLVLQGSLFPNASPAAPCFLSDGGNAPTVKVAGVDAASIDYAGWVSGSVSGLYQINVKLPPAGSSFTGVTKTDGTAGTLGGSTPVKLPIVVTAGGMSSQLSGVNLYAVLSPTVTTTTVNATLNVALDSGTPPNPFILSGGKGTHTFSVTGTGTGTLPTGISMASNGDLSGTPTVSGPFDVVVNVVDGNGWKGTVTLHFEIAAS